MVFSSGLTYDARPPRAQGMSDRLKQIRSKVAASERQAGGNEADLKARGSLHREAGVGTRQEHVCPCGHSLRAVGPAAVT